MTASRAGLVRLARVGLLIASSFLAGFAVARCGPRPKVLREWRGSLIAAIRLGGPSVGLRGGPSASLVSEPPSPLDSSRLKVIPWPLIR